LPAKEGEADVGEGGGKNLKLRRSAVRVKGGDLCTKKCTKKTESEGEKKKERREEKKSCWRKGLQKFHNKRKKHARGESDGVNKGVPGKNRKKQYPKVRSTVKKREKILWANRMTDAARRVRTTGGVWER